MPIRMKQLAKVATMVAALVVVLGSCAVGQKLEEEHEIAWHFEDLRQGFCESMQEYIVEGCKNGADLLTCCSSVAAYEATACQCQLTEASDSWDAKSHFAYGAKYKQNTLENFHNAIERCHLDLIGLGSAEVCSESRVASINFPFLLDWANAGGDKEKGRRILDSWIAKTAFMIYEAVDEQKAAHQSISEASAKQRGFYAHIEDRHNSFPLCAQLALRTASECAPTWNSINPREMSSESMQHILTCCGALQNMNDRHHSCFCQADIIDSLGGAEALEDLKKVAYEACGLNIMSGKFCS